MSFLHSPIVLKKISIENLFVSLTILSLIFGSITNFQPARILPVFAFFYLIINRKIIKPKTIPNFLALLTFIVWIMWGISSLFWTSDISRGVEEVIIITIGFVTFLVFMNFNFRSTKLLNIIRKSWVFSYLLTLPIAIFELITDKHLLISTSGDIGTGGLGRFVYAGVTFGNRNNYVEFIVLCIPFILWTIDISNMIKLKIFYFIIFFSAIIIVFINGSRSGMFCIFIQCFFWFFLQRRNKLKASIKNLVLVIFLFLTCFFAFQIQPASLSRLLSLQDGFVGENQVIRINIFINGLRLFVESSGFGVGAGGLERRVVNDANMLFTGGINSVHNLWIEVLAKYGLFVWVLFVLWLISVFLSAVQARKKFEISKKFFLERAMRASIVLLSSYPLCFLVNSSTFRWAMLWVSFASVSIITDMGIISKSGFNVKRG
jgi:O-antigen ligase